MKLIEPMFKLSEEIIDTIIHFTETQEDVEEEVVYNTVDKTNAYVNKAMAFLLQIETIKMQSNKLSLNKKLFDTNSNQ